MNENELRKLRENPQELARQLRKDYRGVFGTEEGQRVLEDLKKRCYFYNSTFSDDEGLWMMNEGQRNAVLYIERMINMKLEGDNK